MKSKVKLLIMVIIIIAAVCFVNITRSRYLSEVTAVGDIDAAIPIITLNENVIESQLMLPGDSREFEFYVSNKENDSINEVEMNYYLTIALTKTEIPLTYKLYEISNNTQNEVTKTNDKYGPFNLPYGTESQRHFKIVVSWDENDNSYTYAGKENKFNIEINATQVL